MLEKAATYHKSARGAEAIATRHGGLTPRQRSMLILVDGRRGFDELSRLGQLLGDPEQLLQQLADQGYIETGPARAGPPSVPAPLFDNSGWGQVSAPAPLSSSAARGVTLQEAQRAACDKLQDLLGPAGDDLCQRIEACTSAQEFRAAVRSTEVVLNALVGPQLAAQFIRELAPLQPV